MSKIIQCNQLSKQYDDVYAINDFSIQLEENKIYGLIGRNGAGKTTLLKLLANQIFPTSGEVLINDEPFEHMGQMEKVCLAREVIGVKNIEELKVKDILEMASLSYPNWNEELKSDLIRDFELNVKKRYKKLSKGMQTMVGIIIGLSSRAAITLLDEPYVGLDPVARQLFYRYLQEDYAEHPRTIIISTHLMNELQNMFEEVIFIDKGKLLFHKKMEDIQKMAFVLEGKEEEVKDVIKGKKVIHIEKIGRFIAAYVMDTFTDNERRSIRGLDITISGMDLQTLFVHLTVGKKRGITG